MSSTLALKDRLANWLAELPAVAVAVSGGVDSLTLAAAAQDTLGSSATMYHAVSAAVSPACTARLGQLATDRDWQLEHVDAHELSNAAYRENPLDRCFYCKNQLYLTISSRTDAQLISGTNLDDLADFRPGLRAADDHQVRHPFVELSIDKQGVRALARSYGLGELADLPAGPCLASRIETGIPIDSAALRAIDEAERLIEGQLSARTVRCRLRKTALVIELDAEALAAISQQQQSALAVQVGDLFQRANVRLPVHFSAYRMGSAFVAPGP